MGLFSSAARASGTTKLDRLCGQLGWSIDIRKGHVIGLHFRGDDFRPQRTVVVAHKDGDPLMSFSCRSLAEFPEYNLPEHLAPGLLARNEDVALGGWTADIDDDTFALVLRYKAFDAGVDAETFKLICSVMVKEVATLEEKLRSKGLL